MKNESKPTNGPAMKRRTFLTASAISSAGVALSSLPFIAIASPEDKKPSPIKRDTKIVPGTCTTDCSCRCLLNHHVENDVVVRTETDSSGNDEYSDYQIRGCLMGRSTRMRLYTPDRLKYPMKRVGKRGEGRFERISWDEALDTIADSMKRIKLQYGNEAFFLHHAMGVLYGTLTGSYVSGGPFGDLFAAFGGFLEHHDSYSSAQIHAAFDLMYGAYVGNSWDDLQHTDLYVGFGCNVGETNMGGNGQMFSLNRERERRPFKMIQIDPRYQDTCLGKEDQWVPIRPGTDAALAAAIAHVLITEDMVDQEFLDKYCVGYDEKTLPGGAPTNSHYKAYILGDGDDGIEKTPAWAESITGVPFETIVELAREIGAAKRAAIMVSRGVNRHINGEQAIRAVCMLSVLTGNVGVHGGGTGLSTGAWKFGYPSKPRIPNPVKITIPCMKYLEAVEYKQPLTAKKDGLLGGEALNAPMKFLLNYGSNAMLNMHPDINYTKKVLEDESKLEMIIVYDNHLVPSALYADLLLPDVSSIEREDIIQPAYNAGIDAVVYMNPAVSPMFECRDAYWVAHQLSKRLGLEEQFSGGKTKAEWLEYVHELARAKDPSLTTFEQFKKQGLQKLKNPGEPYVALKDFREDPESHPLNTPSGKIEIYSVKMAKALETGALDRSSGLPLLPEFTTGSGSYNDPLTQEYPLQLIGFHGKTRANSSYANVSFLKEITDKLWINPIDAKPRAVKHGERVEVYNDRGRLTIEAKVTIRIMPGVIAAPIGTWHKPDSDGVDHASQLNVLTMKESSPYCKGSTQHTILADVRVWNKRA